MDVDLNDIAVFTEVVDAGSFTAAGKKLGLPPSAVSRRVARLEATLGFSLLHRTTRRLGLTDSGRVFYEPIRIEHDHVQLPDTWWQHLKLSHAPAWFTRRFPVRYRKHEFDKHIYYVYPNLNVQTPREVGEIRVPGVSHRGQPFDWSELP